MTTQDKRYPALEDGDPMPFGKHKDEPMVDVPARYLVWLWNEGLGAEYGKSNCWKDSLPAWMQLKAKLANYIWNCKEDLSKETGELL